MISRTNDRGCKSPSGDSSSIRAPRDWRRWLVAARICVWRGVGVFGLGCVLAGCRAGAPAEWTMERMAMSEAWYEQSQAHRGQDASFQEGWRSGFAEGRASFSQAWTERDPAQFEAYVWEKREQAQARWREGFDAGFTAAQAQKKNHSDHGTLFGIPSLAEGTTVAPSSGSAVNSPVESNPSISLQQPATPATPSLAMEPVPSQTWTPSQGEAAWEPSPSRIAPPAPPETLTGQTSANQNLPGQNSPSELPPLTSFVLPTTPVTPPADTSTVTPGSGPANSLDAAIRRSVDAAQGPMEGNPAMRTDVQPPAVEIAPESPLPVLPESSPSDLHLDPTPPLDLPLDDDDVAQRARPRATSISVGPQVSAAPRLGSWQNGQTIANPYFDGSPSVPPRERPAAEDTTASSPLVVPQFPRTAHRAFHPNQAISTTPTAPPAVLAQHTTVAVEPAATSDAVASTTNATKSAPVAAIPATRTATADSNPLPRHLPLRPRK